VTQSFEVGGSYISLKSIPNLYLSLADKIVNNYRTMIIFCLMVVAMSFLIN